MQCSISCIKKYQKFIYHCTEECCNKNYRKCFHFELFELLEDRKNEWTTVCFWTLSRNFLYCFFLNDSTIEWSNSIYLVRKMSSALIGFFNLPFAHLNLNWSKSLASLSEWIKYWSDFLVQNYKWGNHCYCLPLNSENND